MEYASAEHMLFLNVGHLQLDKKMLNYGCMRMPCGLVYDIKSYMLESIICYGLCNGSQMRF